MKGMSTMIKIRIRNDDHEIDLQFPISECRLTFIGSKKQFVSG